MKLMAATLGVISFLTLSFVFLSPPRVEEAANIQRLATTPQTSPVSLACRPVKASSSYGQYAGLIKYVQSGCYRQVGDARPVLLDPKRDKLAKVFVGEKFQCFAGSMMFELSGSTPGQGATYTVRADDGCQRIKAPAVPRNDGNGPAVDTHGTARAGPTRGDSGPFCDPVNKSWIAPAEFFFRWTPEAVGSVLSLTIFGAEGTLWYADDVNGASGKMVNVEVRNRLQDYRDQGGRNPLKLVIEDSKGQRFSIQFSLLSKVEEDSLTGALDNCAKRGDDIMAPLCRIAAFRERRMYRELAEEYGKALKLAPESEELIAKTAQAYKAIGDVACRPR